jgi:hypothetical protein
MDHFAPVKFYVKQGQKFCLVRTQGMFLIRSQGIKSAL